MSAQSAFWSCFVCYGEPDVQFAKKLVADLEARGVDCWLYEKDATVGARTQEEIGQKRREAEKVIVLCSYRSLIQEGVLSELDDQIRENPDKLIPVSLDDVWQHPGFRVMWGTRDLKPLLVERTYANFRDESVYDTSLSRLIRALERGSKVERSAPLAPKHGAEPDRRATASPLVDSKALERRVAGIATLLKVRGEAKDFAFAPQILHELASVLALKYRLLPSDALDEPRVHLKLIELMRTRAFSSTTFSRDLQDQGWDASRLQLFFEQASDAVSRQDRQPGVIDLVQHRLSVLYTLVAALVVVETDERAAEAKVQIALPSPKMFAPQESDSIEYKSSLRYNLATKQVDTKLEFDVIKAIAGFANHKGGMLYIGVSDKGEILGLEQDLSTFKGANRNTEDVFRRHFDELVMNYFGKANYQIVEPEWAEPEGRRVFVVKVKSGSTPTFVKSRDDGEFYVRRGATTMQLLPQRFLEYYRNRWPAGRAAD